MFSEKKFCPKIKSGRLLRYFPTFLDVSHISGRQNSTFFDISRRVVRSTKLDIFRHFSTYLDITRLFSTDHQKFSKLDISQHFSTLLDFSRHYSTRRKRTKNVEVAAGGDLYYSKKNATSYISEQLKEIDHQKSKKIHSEWHKICDTGHI